MNSVNLTWKTEVITYKHSVRALNMLFYSNDFIHLYISLSSW